MPLTFGVTQTADPRQTFYVDVSNPQDLTVSTSAGSVDVEVPDEVYRVDAHASAGSAHVEVRTDPDATRRITASTSAGSIRIHRGRAPS